jgi:spore germination protein GerM
LCPSFVGLVAAGLHIVLAKQIAYFLGYTGDVNNGYFSAINPGVVLNKLTIENGVAKADFNDLLNMNVAGSCRVAMIRAQITQTLKQFPTVKSVVISVNGATDTILQP